MTGRRALPPLELLQGFEAAARHLSFTLAGGELHLTQSAISRQVQALEEYFGQPLFLRRHRRLELTLAGQQFQQVVSGLLAQLAESVARIRGVDEGRLVNVTTTVSFASLWLVPRLPSFRAVHPGIDVRISADGAVLDLERERMDLAIRYVTPERAPPASERLFGEDVLPVCAPALLENPQRPLKTTSDLRHQVLLHFDDQPPRQSFLDWDNWLEAMDLSGLKPAGVLRFSHYDQVIQAAIAGEGVALGRLPMMAAQLKRQQLVAPFEPRCLPGRRPRSSRAFYLVRSAAAAQRPEVQQFAEWLRQQACSEPA